VCRQSYSNLLSSRTNFARANAGYRTGALSVAAGNGWKEKKKASTLLLHAFQRPPPRLVDIIVSTAGASHTLCAPAPQETFSGHWLNIDY